MHVAVVIPTFNRPQFLRDALQSVYAQDYPANLISIVVMDNASSPPVAALPSAPYGMTQTLIRLDRAASLAQVRRQGTALGRIRGRGMPAAPAPLGRCHPRAGFAVGRKHAVTNSPGVNVDARSAPAGGAPG